MTALKACRRAAAALLALGIYLEAMEWIDLYPWNNIRGGNGQQTLDYAIAAVVAALAAWLWRGGRIPALLALAFAGFWGWLQVTTWWIPYIAGASPQWQRVYDKWFGGCIQILPAAPGHPPPDANHLVLDLLVAAAFVTAAQAAVAAFRDGARRGAP
ncbi:MAG TPA: hypothetical protein VMH86_03695 [Rhizomicrobium sp.]|nr:hypothetical protein [Rhizomicrobium sp.]